MTKLVTDWRIQRCKKDFAEAVLRLASQSMLGAGKGEQKLASVEKDYKDCFPIYGPYTYGI